MKETGIVRNMDALGRIVIPAELRKTLGLHIKDAIEIYVQDDTIILKKHLSSCVLCGSETDIMELNGKNVCKACASQLAAQL